MKTAMNMPSSGENCKGTEAKYDVDDLHLFSHSLSVKLEYYRCFEFNFKWNRHMSPRCSSRLSKASKTRVKKHPKPSQDVTADKQRRQTRRARLKNVDGCKAEADDEKDILDLIDSSREDAVEIVDNGLDVSDEDLDLDCCSIVSGPSMVCHTPSKKPESSHGFCSACRELYQKAKRTKAPIKNKLLDNDPKSLTCDQWVLIKTFGSRRLPEANPKRLTDAQLKKVAPLRPGVSSLCSRPHIFLQRNLRRVKMAARKETKRSRRKRRRDSSQGCHVAKQRRLQSDKGQKPSVSHRTHDHPDGSFSSRASSRRRSGPKMGSRVDPEPPSSAVLNTTAQLDSKQKNEKCGFKQLLAQLRGNSSMIVKEK